MVFRIRISSRAGRCARLLSVMVPCLAAAIGTASAASFDCAKATTNVEKAVCANPALGNLDEAMAAAYRKRSAALAGDELKQIKASQIVWIKSRDASCGSSKKSKLDECLERQYEERLATLVAPDLPKSVVVGDRQIRWSDRLMVAGPTVAGATQRLVFRDYDHGEQGGGRHRLLSIVGPRVSYLGSYHWMGGAHPGARSAISMHDVARENPESLVDLFGEAAVFAQLLPYFRRCGEGADCAPRADMKKPKTLTEFFDLADGGCEMWIDRDLLVHFAFRDVSDGRVTVEVGLSHGCEVMRGNLTVWTLTFPVPEKLRAELEAAKRGGLLSATLAPKRD